MKSHAPARFGGIVRGLLLSAFFVPLLLKAQTAQVQFVTIEKKHFYAQTGVATVVDAALPWQFTVSVDGANLSTIAIPSYTTPAGSTTTDGVLQIDPNGSGNWLVAPSLFTMFATQSALDGAFNSGTYVITVQGTPISLNVSGNVYPNAPQVSTSAGTWTGGVLAVDPTQPLTLTTNVFTAFNQNAIGHIDFQVLRVSDDSNIGEVQSFSSSTPSQSSVSLTIPADTLSPGETYTVGAGFDSAVSEQTSVGSDFGGYGAVTTFTMQAAQSSGGDGSAALVGKYHYFVQTGANNLAEDVSRGAPWQFMAQIDGSPNDTDSKTVTLPGALTPQSFAFSLSDDQWEFPATPQIYSSQAAMDGIDPDGTYQLAFAGTSIATSLTGDTYPNTPTVQFDQGGWSGNKLVVDITQPLNLSTGFTSNFAANHAHLSIELQSGNNDSYNQHADSGIVDLSQNQLTMTVPAHSLGNGSTHDLLLHLDYVSELDSSSVPGFAVASLYESMTTLSVMGVAGGLNALPVVSAQPVSTAVDTGGNANLSVTASAGVALTYQWQLNGNNLTGANSSSLSLTNLQPSNTGLYTAAVIGGVTTISNSAILGILTTDAVDGGGDVLATDIQHPNGKFYDQVLVTGPALSVTANYAVNRVTRTSYIDDNGDIVQVEFAGHGTLSLVLGDPSGPAVPVNYTQPSVQYMQGHAGIVIVGADETTNVLVFTVGRATAFDPTGHYNILLSSNSTTNNPSNNGSPLFVGHESTDYDGIADIAFIAIESTDGKFGGLRSSDARYSANQGLTGVYAPDVAFQGPVYIGDIHANGSATPVIVIGSTGDARITGGNLAQYNGKAVKVSGLTHLVFTAGGDAGGDLLPAQDNQAVLKQNGVDVTGQIVVNPGP